MPRRPLAAALAAVLLLATAACGDDGDGGGDAEELTGVTVSGEFGEPPTVETTDAFEATDDPTSAEVVVGDGEELTKESVVLAKVAVFDRDGKLVQGNFDSEAKERIDLAEGRAPWLGELAGNHIGSRVAVALPVSDVIGPQGAPESGLDPDEPMIFVVDVLEEAEPPLDAPEGETVEPPARAPKVVGDETAVRSIDFSDAPRNPPGRLQVIPLIEGEGPEVEQNQQVTVNYFGALWGKGNKPFDSSFERDDPTTFPLSKGGLIDGWIEGLEGVEVGSRVMLVIPPELGYGKQGGGAEIPPDSTLVFVIDVLAAN
jgi:peptidylprolyl isomerase